MAGGYDLKPSSMGITFLVLDGPMGGAEPSSAYCCAGASSDVVGVLSHER